MALTYVGGITGTKAGATSGNTTLSLTALTGGSNAAAAAGDIVIAVFATGSAADRTLAITDGTTAYTLIGAELYANGTSYDTNLRVAYKVLTGADATVTFGPTGNNADAGAMAVHVWRGISASNPIDVTTTTATGTASGKPNGAAITPVTSGAVILVAGGAAAATGAAFTQSGAELSNFRSATSVDTNDAMVGIGSKAWTSGAFDPVVWTGGTANAADSWAAITVALRPFVAVTHTTTGTPTGQGSTVSGTAQHNAAHSTSGALTGPGSTVVGSAARFRAHAGTGGLIGQGAVITGSADRQDAPAFVEHATSGVLTGQGSLVVGAAARTRAHGATGGVSGPGSIVVGASARVRAFTSSGGLVGQGSELSGTASRVGQAVTHDTTGDLTGQASTLSGAAGRSGDEGTTTPGGDDAPHGIYYQNQKRRKIGRRPLDKLLDKAIKEYGEGLAVFIESEKEEVKAIVAPFVDEGVINYESLRDDIDAIKQLIAEYQAYLLEQDEEEILILLMVA